MVHGCEVVYSDTNGHPPNHRTLMAFRLILGFDSMKARRARCGWKYRIAVKSFAGNGDSTQCAHTVRVDMSYTRVASSNSSLSPVAAWFIQQRVYCIPRKIGNRSCT